MYVFIYGRMSDFIYVSLIMTEFYDCHNSWLSDVDKLIIKLSTVTKKKSILYYIIRYKTQAQVCIYICMCVHTLDSLLCFYVHAYIHISLYFRKTKFVQRVSVKEESLEILLFFFCVITCKQIILFYCYCRILNFERFSFFFFVRSMAAATSMAASFKEFEKYFSIKKILRFFLFLFLFVCLLIDCYLMKFKGKMRCK